MRVQLWSNGRLVKETRELTPEVAKDAYAITVVGLANLPHFNVVMVEDDESPAFDLPKGGDWDGMKVPLHPHDQF